MVFFSNCKINIGLNIIGKRPDGFHDLETLFYPVPLYDVLEILPAEETSLHLHGIEIPGPAADNIVLKAWQLLKDRIPSLPAAAFHLLKNIPAGAGLGAGSANGATALKALNEWFRLNLPQKELMAYALELGSDCPFFILNQPCFGSGRGEDLVPAAIRLHNYKLVIVNPGIHISTPWAFSKITPAKPAQSLTHLVKEPVHHWQRTIKNDFEAGVFKQYPQIAMIKEQLLQAGSVFCQMTGTGSTVFSLFKKELIIPAFPQEYYVRELPLF